MALLVSSVCGTAAWQPRPFARKVRGARRAGEGACEWRGPRRGAACGRAQGGASRHPAVVAQSGLGPLRPHARALPGAAPTQESTRLLGLLAAHACPVRASALQPPALPKILAHVKRHLQARGRRHQGAGRGAPRSAVSRRPTAAGAGGGYGRRRPSWHSRRPATARARAPRLA
jgi:hypothetical protein